MRRIKKIDYIFYNTISKKLFLTKSNNKFFLKIMSVNNSNTSYWCDGIIDKIILLYFISVINDY